MYTTEQGIEYGVRSGKDLKMGILLAALIEAQREQNPDRPTTGTTNYPVILQDIIIRAVERYEGGRKKWRTLDEERRDFRLSSPVIHEGLLGGYPRVALEAAAETVIALQCMRWSSSADRFMTLRRLSRHSRLCKDFGLLVRPWLRGEAEFEVGTEKVGIVRSIPLRKLMEMPYGTMITTVSYMVFLTVCTQHEADRIGVARARSLPHYDPDEMLKRWSIELAKISPVAIESIFAPLDGNVPGVERWVVPPLRSDLEAWKSYYKREANKHGSVVTHS